jgi:prolyl-tRNA editing enzyme YbaK/EbsC (Cys-tRNA(Pro) deacylase)
MTSGAHRVNTEALAERIGVAALDQTTPAFVKEATGQTIGGVSPVGHLRPIRTVIDASLAAHERIRVAAGAPDAVFPTTFEELRALTSGHIEEFT